MLNLKDNKKIQVLFGVCLFIASAYLVYSYFIYIGKQDEILEEIEQAKERDRQAKERDRQAEERQKQILENQRRHEQMHLTE